MINRQGSVFAAVAWLLFTVAIIIFSDPHRTVSYNYWLAAQHWLTAQPLYSSNGKGFIYLPQSAIFYIPLAKLSFAVSEWFWKSFSLIAFGVGIGLIASQIAVVNRQSSQWIFGLLIVLAIPLSFDSARNGQMHILMMALMMFTAVALTKKNWTIAGLLLIIAFFLKPTALVFLLLAAGLFFKKLWHGLLMFALLFLSLPFLTQSNEYVIQQYQAAMFMLSSSANLGTLHPQDWAQLFNLFSQFGWNIPMLWQNLIRLLAALIFLGWALRIKKSYDLPQTVLWWLSLSVIYLVLFNPRTENNDYVMLTPAIGFLISKAIEQRQKIILGILYLIPLGIIFSFYLSFLFPGHRNWAAPLMGMIFLVVMIQIYQNDSKSSLLMEMPSPFIS